MKTNADHTTFKEPFPKHEKGETSKPKSGKVVVNYTYTDVENTINMLGFVEENVNMMSGRDPYDYDLDEDSPPIFDREPIVLLRGPNSRKSSQDVNAIN